MTGLSRPFVYTVLSRRCFGRNTRKVPQPPTCNACRLSHTLGLACSGFARHYSRNRCCFLFLWVLRCFTSPRSLYPPYIFRRESPGTHAPWRGFPIRKSSDQSSLISSPRLIADCYVLLRLQMPRHPPFALKDLKSHEFYRLRCSRPLCSSQSTGGTLPATSLTPAQRKAQKDSVTRRCPVPQDPTACTPRHPLPHRSNHRSSVLTGEEDQRGLVKCSTHELPAETFALIRALSLRRAQCSLERR